MERRSVFEESLDLLPVFAHDFVGAQVAASLQELQIGSGSLGELDYRLVGDVGIVLGVEHQDLFWIDLAGVVGWVVELFGVQLLPILVGQAIAVAEGFANVGGVVRVGSLCVLGTAKDSPVDHRAIGDDLIDAAVERAEDGSRAAEAAADHEGFLRFHLKRAPKGQFAKLFLESADYIEDVFVRRACQELASAFPGAAIARIEHPVAFGGEEFGKRLFAWDGRHAIAEHDDALFLCRSGGRKKFGQDFALESRTEHGHGGVRGDPLRRIDRPTSTL